jgi:hypothetical protein
VTNWQQRRHTNEKTDTEKKHQIGGSDGVGACVLELVRENARRAECFEDLLDPNGPRFFLGLV